MKSSNTTKLLNKLFERSAGPFILGFSVLISLVGSIGVPIAVMSQFNGWLWYSSWFIIPILSVLTSYCQLKCNLTNPGYMPFIEDLPNNKVPGLHSVRFCRKCDTYKPPRSHHCSLCNRCVFKMDHHCPWIDNCIGIYNQKHFLIFLIYTFLYSTYCFIFSVVTVFNCPDISRFLILRYLLVTYTSFGRDQEYCNLHWTQAIFCMLTFSFSFLFMMFSLLMFISQLMIIISNTTEIDRLKNIIYGKRTSKHIIYEIFGESFSWRWFFPIDVSYKNCMKIFTPNEQIGILLYENELYEDDKLFYSALEKLDNELNTADTHDNIIPLSDEFYTTFLNNIKTNIRVICKRKTNPSEITQN